MEAKYSSCRTAESEYLMRQDARDGLIGFENCGALS
jgi:hypothetical protein